MEFYLGHEGNIFLSVKIIFCLFNSTVTLSQCKIFEKSMHQNKTTKPTMFSRLQLSILVGWKSLWDFHLVGGIKADHFLKTFAFKHMTDHPKIIFSILRDQVNFILTKGHFLPPAPFSCILLSGLSWMYLCALPGALLNRSG